MLWKWYARLRWAIRRRFASRERRRAWALQERRTMQPEEGDYWTVTKWDHRCAAFWAYIFDWIDH